MGNCFRKPKRTATVIPVSPANEEFRRDNTDLTMFNVSQRRNRVVSVKSRKNKTTDSLEGSISSQAVDGRERGVSIGQSSDSGITEQSEQHVIGEVKETVQSNGGLELEIKGVRRYPTRMIARQRASNDEAKVLQLLKDEGLIAKTIVKSVGGLSFDIVQEKSNTSRPPAKLEKLEKRRKKNKILTEEDILAKLERAEQRRKRREEERLVRVRMERPAIPSPLDVCAQRVKRFNEMQTQKMSQIIDNREQRLNEIRDRLRRQECHGQVVRKLKECNLDGMTPQPEEMNLRSGLTSAFNPND